MYLECPVTFQENTLYFTRIMVGCRVEGDPATALGDPSTDTGRQRVPFLSQKESWE